MFDYSVVTYVKGQKELSFAVELVDRSGGIHTQTEYFEHAIDALRYSRAYGAQQIVMEDATKVFETGVAV